MWNNWVWDKKGVRRSGNNLLLVNVCGGDEGDVEFNYVQREVDMEF